MKLLTIAALALVALVSADVSHLQRSYLPPSRTTTFSASHGYSTGHGGISTIGVHKEKLIAAPVLGTKSQQHVHSAPAQTYEAHLASPAISHSRSSYLTSSSQIDKVPQLPASIVHHAITAPEAAHHVHSSPVAVSSSSYVSGDSHKEPLINHASHHSTSHYIEPTQHVTHHQIHQAPIVHHDIIAPVTTHQAYSLPVAVGSSSYGSGGHPKEQLSHNHASHHSTSNYIAPTQHVTHHQIHHAPIVHNDIAASVPKHQAYSLPVAVGSSSHVGDEHLKAHLSHNQPSHHITSNYIAPTQHVTHHQIHHAPIVNNDIAAASIPKHQAYSLPVAVGSSSHASDDHHKAQLGHNHPSHTISNYLAPVVVPAHHIESHQTHHSAPAKQAYATSHHATPASSYSNFNSYTVPASDIKHKTHSAPAVVHHYAAPAVSHTYSSAAEKYTAPSLSHSFISPAAALEKFSKSLGHKKHSAPSSHSHGAILSTDSSASGYDTKYAADGGYVY